jgi:hypothetical protein
MKKVSLPKIKKDILLFLTNEEGKIEKKKIVDFGFKVAVVAFMLSGMAVTDNRVDAACSHVSHSAHSSHGSHASHSSHASHGSHGQW